MTRQSLLIVLLLLQFLPRCPGQNGTLQLYQNGYYIQQYSELNGLVNNQCKNVFEDSRGFLWVATFQGLSRFDGRQFINYGLKQGLPSIDTWQVCEDSSGYIYVATSKGIARYIGRNAKNDSCFYVYSQTVDMGFAITGMQAIDSSTIVFQCMGKELFLLHKGQLSVLWKKPFKYTTSILKDKNNNIYAYTTDTIRVYNKNLARLNDIYFPNHGYISLYHDNNNGIIHAYSNGKMYQLTPGGLTNASSAPDSVVWFCKTVPDKNIFYSRNRDQLFFYDGIKHTRIFDLSALSLYSNDLFQASDKSLWMSTSTGGIFRIKPLPFYELTVPKGGYTSMVNNRLLFNTDDSLLRLPSVADTYERLKGTVIRSVFMSSSGTIWFCTGNGIYKQVAGKRAEHFLFKGGDEENYGSVANEIRGVAEDSRGDLWFYGYCGLIHYSNGQFKQYTSRNGLGRDILVRNLVIDKTGTVLLTDFVNLYRVQGDTVLPVNKHLGLTNYVPGKIKTDNNGFAWIDHNKKLFKIEGQQNGNYKITDSIIPYDAITSPEIAKVEFDGQNNCWIGYNGGRIQILFAGKNNHYHPANSVTFSPDDGLALVTSADYNFFPGKNGNIAIVPRKSDNEKAFIFPVENAIARKQLPGPDTKLTGILVNHEIPGWSTTERASSQEFPPSPRFGHKDNDITFEYTAPLLSNPSDIIYQVKLRGYDKDWRTTTDITAVYTNLPPGDYTFLARAAKSNGVWNDPVEYDFTILLPWYKMWWAILLWSVLLLSMVFTFFFLRIKSVRKTDALNNLKKTNRFNSTLIGLISHDMLTPIQYISKVSEILQTHHEKLGSQTTQESLSKINATASQLHFFGENLMHWIKMQDKEFRPQFRQFNLTGLIDELIEFHQPMATEKKNRLLNELPAELSCRYDPMIIKIIIHNLLVNANKFTSSGTIRVEAAAIDNLLTISVKDTGKGMNKDRVALLNGLQPIDTSEGSHKETGWGMGYVLITDLLKRSKGSLHVESEPDVGTTITIKLPLVGVVSREP